tara:strand:+ start:228 stop:596 length:369 start_codon:yes stop_codon:yes gene_type:complete
MAKFIKFDLTTPGGATGNELLIPLDAVVRVSTASTTTTDVFLNTASAASTKWTVTHTIPLVANAVLDAIQAAMVANPGGYVSTVGGPINTAQAPVAQSGQQGQPPITQPAVYVTFTSAVYTP